MSNPTISFRLQPYHIARALKIMRSINPNYSFSSPAKIVSDCFFDYLDKMSTYKNSQITLKDLEEISAKTYQRPITDIGDFASQLQSSRKVVSQENSLNALLTSCQPAVKSVVEDFSPPSSWLEDDNTDTTKAE